VSTPMRRIRSGCCARAASGQAAAPPMSVVNARRLVRGLLGLNRCLPMPIWTSPRIRAECGARSPAGAGLWAHLFCRCSLFDRFFGGVFALSIGFVQEPIDDARTALLFDPSLLRFLLFGEELVISFPAH